MNDSPLARRCEAHVADLAVPVDPRGTGWQVLLTRPERPMQPTVIELGTGPLNAAQATAVAMQINETIAAWAEARGWT